MAKKTRKIKTSSDKSLFAWPRVLLIIVPLFAAVVVMFGSSNGRAVLGVKDTNMLKLDAHKEASSSGHENNKNNPKCKQNRVASFSLSTLCTNGNGFKSYSYTCEDGVFATVTKNCVNPQSAFEYAKKACSKTSECAKIEASKKLSRTPKSTGSTEHSNTQEHNPSTGL